jgi:NhaP-type Na+/H+ or K+/H+ antiporter
LLSSGPAVPNGGASLCPPLDFKREAGEIHVLPDDRVTDDLNHRTHNRTVVVPSLPYVGGWGMNIAEWGEDLGIVGVLVFAPVIIAVFYFTVITLWTIGSKSVF